MESFDTTNIVYHSLRVWKVLILKQQIQLIISYHVYFRRNKLYLFYIGNIKHNKCIKRKCFKYAWNYNKLKFWNFFLIKSLNKCVLNQKICIFSFVIKASVRSENLCRTGLFLNIQLFQKYKSKFLAFTSLARRNEILWFMLVKN